MWFDARPVGCFEVRGIRVRKMDGRARTRLHLANRKREATARWAEYRDAEIAARHVAENESGGTPGSPRPREAIERIESGHFGPTPRDSMTSCLASPCRQSR